MVVNLSPVAPASLHELITVLQSIGPDSCPYDYNFHLHTHFSDGQLRPEHLVEQVYQLGLKGLAITDHHSVEGYYRAQSLMGTSGAQLWSGVEITCELLACEVHILGYAFDPKHEALAPYLRGSSVWGATAKAVINAIHAASGLAILAHPCRYARSTTDIVTRVIELGIDGLEAYYSYRNTDPWIPSPKQTALVESLANDSGLYKTCGTDTHGSLITRRI